MRKFGIVLLVLTLLLLVVFGVFYKFGDKLGFDLKAKLFGKSVEEEKPIEEAVDSPYDVSKAPTGLADSISLLVAEGGIDESKFQTATGLTVDSLISILNGATEANSSDVGFALAYLHKMADRASLVNFTEESLTSLYTEAVAQISPDVLAQLEADVDALRAETSEEDTTVYPEQHLVLEKDSELEFPEAGFVAVTDSKLVSVRESRESLLSEIEGMIKTEDPNLEGIYQVSVDELKETFKNKDFWSIEQIVNLHQNVTEARYRLESYFFDDKNWKIDYVGSKFLEYRVFPKGTVFTQDGEVVEQEPAQSPESEAAGDGLLDWQRVFLSLIKNSKESPEKIKELTSFSVEDLNAMAQDSMAGKDSLQVLVLSCTVINMDKDLDKLFPKKIVTGLGRYEIIRKGKDFIVVEEGASAGDLASKELLEAADISSAFIEKKNIAEGLRILKEWVESRKKLQRMRQRQGGSIAGSVNYDDLPTYINIDGNDVDINKKIDSMQRAMADMTSKYNSAIEKLKESVNILKRAETSDSDLKSRLSTLEKTVGKLKKSGGAGSSKESLADMEAIMQYVNEAIASNGASVDPAIAQAVDQLTQEISDIKVMMIGLNSLKDDVNELYMKIFNKPANSETFTSVQQDTNSVQAGEDPGQGSNAWYKDENGWHYDPSRAAP